MKHGFGIEVRLACREARAALPPGLPAAGTRTTMMKMFWLLLIFCNGAVAGVSALDDSGNKLSLASPAKRIVSLAPNLTELLFAAGAGERVVGVVEYSDYPSRAKSLPRVGSYQSLDLEAIMALRPDLVVAWSGGNSPAQLDRLKTLGIPVFFSELERLQAIPAELEKLGRLAGSEKVARQAALDYSARYAALQSRYSARPQVRVFYEIWNQPLMTIGGRQIINDAIEVCGGSNIFGEVAALSPGVSIEAVLAANPEAIVASGMDNVRPPWLDDWRRWRGLAAAARDNLYFIPADLINRPSSRILDGVERLCRQIDEARAKRNHPALPQ